MERIRELRYKTSNIQRQLIIISEKADNRAKVAKLLLTIPNFRVGEFIPSTDITSCLQNIYDTIGIKAKASIDDFRYYATIEGARKRKSGRLVRGYIIQYIKISFIFFYFHHSITCHFLQFWFKQESGIYPYIKKLL